MLLRFIYKLWNNLLKFLLITVIAFVILTAGVLLFLQSSSGKSVVAGQIEDWFNNRYHGELSIGELDGPLPFRAEAKDIQILTQDDSGAAKDTLMHAKQMELRPFWADMLRRRISVHDIRFYEVAFNFDFNKPEQVRAFQRREIDEAKTDLLGAQRSLYLPGIAIYEGEVQISNLDLENEAIDIPEKFQLTDLNTELFFESEHGSIFFDFDSFSASLSGLPTESLEFAGQIYSDSTTFELNGFNLQTGESAVSLNAGASNLNSFDELLSDNDDIRYNLNIRRGSIALNEWSQVFPNLANYPYPVSLTGEIQGPINELELDNFNFQGHKAEISTSGSLRHIRNPEERELDLTFSDARIGSEEVELLGLGELNDVFNDWELITAAGALQLDPENLNITSDFDFPEGLMKAEVEAGLRDSSLVADFEIEGFESHKFPSLEISESEFNGKGTFTSNGFDPATMDGEFDVEFDQSYYDHLSFLEGGVAGSIADGMVEGDYHWQFNSGRVEGTGSYNFADEGRHLIIDGRTDNLDLELFQPYWDEIPSTSLNFDYEFNIEGRTVDEIFGFARVDIDESVVDGDSLRAHQLYVDLDSPKNETRNLRFTSSFIDLIMEGRFTPTTLYNQVGYWAEYLNEEWQQSVALEDKMATVENSFTDRINDENIEIEGIIEVKDLELLQNYVEFSPQLAVQSEMQFNLNMSADNFLLNSSFSDDSLSTGRFAADNVSGQLFAHFKQPGTIRDFGDVDINVTSDRASLYGVNASGVSLDAHLADGFFESDFHVERIGEESHVDGRMASRLTEDELQSRILELVIAGPHYEWNLDEPSELVYHRRGALHVSNFKMINEDQLLSVEGVFSEEEEDSVAYNMQNINLQRISDMVDRRVSFDGQLNGEFITRTLTTSPFFDGALSVDHLSIEGRTVGDANLSSSFNLEENQFDTELSIVTDPDTYADYLEENDNIGQEIHLTGSFAEPDLDNPENEFFSFDADFQQIDLWVLEHIVNNVFEDAEGEGRGTGTLSGSLEDIDFHGDFTVLSSELEPVFFETIFEITGDVTVNRHEGVTLHDLQVHDGRNGTGELFGNVAFNDFEDERNLDLTFAMENMRFLNNSYDPDVPFYGTAYGSGVVTVTGTNRSPVVSTTEIVDISSRSSLSIPMAGVGTTADERRFIQFVSDFSEASFVQQEFERAGVTGSIDRGFTETFTLDLEFNAPDNINVELIFDRVTGEILNAQGSGNMRITLADEEFGMIGRYEVDSGNYRFVGGDIFTRQFSLREGGTIIWDGDPANARLDIEAAYRSRPNINALLETAEAEGPAQRIPVDLVLEITGTIQEVENDFYFEFPDAIDATQNAAVLSVLNSEDQKLLQATALLLTGGFIPVGQDGFAQAQQFSTTIQERAGAVGLSQLVSAQINEVLNTNLANLDIDLNMIGFDQADLGIALRLFDDRLELRRDGQVTGEEADIGDLGATYRINPTFSVEVFHRKDPTLISAIGRQAQEESVNGVGLEAQVQFNTWQELRERITSPFRRLFGSSSEEEDEDEDDDEEEGLATDN